MHSLAESFSLDPRDRCSRETLLYIKKNEVCMFAYLLLLVAVLTVSCPMPAESTLPPSAARFSTLALGALGARCWPRCRSRGDGLPPHGFQLPLRFPLGHLHPHMGLVCGSNGARPDPAERAHHVCPRRGVTLLGPTSFFLISITPSGPRGNVSAHDGRPGGLLHCGHSVLPQRSRLDRPCARCCVWCFRAPTAPQSRSCKGLWPATNTLQVQSS